MPYEILTSITITKQILPEYKLLHNTFLSKYIITNYEINTNK